MTGIAHVHPSATLQPSKLELLAGWLPTRPWFDGDPAQLQRLAAFRFVDPAGEVGLDTMLVACDQTILHVPVTWRAEPLADGDLIGTLEHSVLGTRYCYDGPSDPVYVTELERVIRQGDTAADIQAEGEKELRPHTVQVRGSGIEGGRASGSVEVIRHLGGLAPDGIGRLLATWEDQGRGRSDVLAVLH